MRSSILFALIVGLFLVVGPAPQTEADSDTNVNIVLLGGANRRVPWRGGLTAGFDRQWRVRRGCR